MNGSRAGGGGGGGGEAALALPLLLLLAGAGLLSAAANLLLLAALGAALRTGRPCAARAALLSLAAADLLLALDCLPARAAAYARRSWARGALACRTADWLLHGCLAAKSLSWAAAARARAAAAAAPPTGPGAGAGWRRGRAAEAALWAAALLLALPHLLFARVEPAAGAGRACVLRAPPAAARFMAAFAKLYPPLACLAPAGVAGWSGWRALRAERRRGRGRGRGHGQGRPRGRAPAGGPPDPTPPPPPRLLLALALLFHATWLPEWARWLWERHARPGPPPPPALRFAAELLVFLNGSLGAGLLLAASPGLRRGLAGARCCAARAPQGLRGEAAGRVLPDVEHFWRDAAAGEPSDPLPWEHRRDP